MFCVSNRLRGAKYTGILEEDKLLRLVPIINMFKFSSSTGGSMYVCIVRTNTFTLNLRITHWCDVMPSRTNFSILSKIDFELSKA